MSKLQLIIKREFIAKVRNKSFIVMTFLSPLITVGMGALVYFLMKKNDEKVKKIVYVDESRMFSEEDFTDSKTVQYVDFSAMGIEETKPRPLSAVTTLQSYDSSIALPTSNSGAIIVVCPFFSSNPIASPQNPVR